MSMLEGKIYEATLVKASDSPDGETPDQVVLCKEANAFILWRDNWELGPGHKGTESILGVFSLYNPNEAIEKSVRIAADLKAQVEKEVAARKAAGLEWDELDSANRLAIIEAAPWPGEKIYRPEPESRWRDLDLEDQDIIYSVDWRKAIDAAATKGDGGVLEETDSNLKQYRDRREAFAADHDKTYGEAHS